MNDVTLGQAFAVVGLGFGDEGKGSLVDALVRRHRARVVVRFNGGCQAAHHVVSPEGLVHCFSQFGAGTLVPGVRTHLARFVAVDPLALEREEAALRDLGVSDAFARLSLDPRCVVVTPFHRAINRIREIARGDARHGSVGLGVGEALLDAERGGMPVVRVGDALDPARLLATLRLLWRMKIDLAEQLEGGAGDRAEALAGELRALRRPEPAEVLAQALVRLVRESGARLAEGPEIAPGEVAVFEGAQGVLLDRDHGFWPHVTPSHTTFAHAREVLAGAGFAGALTRVGILRAYATRHGAGPFVTEDRALTATIPDAHNGAHAWQGAFRVGWFDAVAARYARRATGGVDALAITNLDRLSGLDEVRVCTAYETEGRVLRDLPALDGASFDSRAAQTARLDAYRPVYTVLPGWRSAADPEAAAFLRFLGSDEALGIPISIASWGPRAGDKTGLS
jgi:adenylosuccinate synthase